MDRLQKLINEIREFGIKNNIPIMSEDTIEYINGVIKENNINTILEIGTAIGYSTICFASNNIENITSIERDPIREDVAINYVKESGLNNIQLIAQDALNIDLHNKKYDLIIIDAAKSQNIKFFEKFENNLSDNGIIIIDNLDFHGYVGNSKDIKSRNLRQMVRKIEKFIDYLNSNEKYDTIYIEVGDRLALCKKKNL